MMQRDVVGDSPKLESESMPQFWSADSLPEGFAVERAAWLTPLFLLVFAVASAVMIGYSHQIGHVYKAVLASTSGLASATMLAKGSLGFRPFFGLLTVILALFSAGSWKSRIGRALLITFLFILGTLATDTAFVRFRHLGAPSPFSTLGNVTSGFVGVLLLAASVFGWYHLPENIVIRRQVGRSYLPQFLVLLGSVAIAAGLMMVAFHTGAELLNTLRDHALLGGLGPGIALFLPGVLVALFVWGRAALTLQRPKPLPPGEPGQDESLPSVAFLVPAYNEEEQIRQCIEALDAAAANYGGSCRLYLVDNNSEDRTNAVAHETLAQCKVLKEPRGEVLVCEKPGKSVALNYGLRRIREDIVVRVDADTIVTDSLLLRIIPYFDDPNVGGASGMPLPKHRLTPMGIARTIEVYYNVAFNRVAQAAIDAIMVLPGIMSAYRREPLQQLGGFAEDINGEDTDMSVQLGRLGYKLVDDPSIRVYTEVPSSFAHLREQRMRWSRSLYHVVSRNISAIWMLQGPRGAWVLAWAVYYASRRLIVLPILVYGGVLLVMEPTNPAIRGGAAVIAVMVGPQLFLLALVLLGYGKVGYIPLIPGFLVFRLLRVYFALESYFTLPMNAPVPATEPSHESIEVPATASTQTAGTRSAAAGVASPAAGMPPVVAGAHLFTAERARALDLRSIVPPTQQTHSVPQRAEELERLVPPYHPLRRIKSILERVPKRLTTAMAVDGDEPDSISPSIAMKSSLLINAYGLRDTRELCDRLGYDAAFRWFLDLDRDSPVFAPGDLEIRRQRVLANPMARRFLEAVTREAERRGLSPKSPGVLNGSATQRAAEARSGGRSTVGAQPATGV